jgi:hypothetical protein
MVELHECLNGYCDYIICYGYRRVCNQYIKHVKTSQAIERTSGKTPLTMKSLITVTVVGIFEGLVILILTYLISRFGFNQDRIDFVVIVFLIIYMIRTAVAYLIAWGVWAIFVAIDSKKMKKKLDEQRERVL